MARVWALLCLTAFAAVGYCQTDPCSVFPAECTLQPGLVFSANGSTVQHVGTSRYEYFNLTVPEGNPSFIRLVLSAVSGDPDVYIKKNADNQPSFFVWDWCSRESSSQDVITIPSANFSSGDTFAVAVQGFRESLYRLTFIVSGVPTQVVNGVPVSDNVGTGAYQYYTFSTVMTGQPVEVVLTRLTGDPDLVIAYGTFLPTMGRNNQTGLAFGDDVLSIPNINTPVGTVYTIGVYGSVTSSFTLVVSQNQTTSLVDGVPQAASVPSGSATSFVYYTSGNSTAPLTMLISVTTGSLEYFISSAQGDVPAYPSRTSNNWFGYATYSTPAQLTISSDSPNYLNVRGGYYIVVYANSNSSTDFTITFKSAVSVAALVDGSPAFDTVGRQQYRYYSFYVSNNSLDVTVDLTPLSGDADVFVSCNGTVTGDDSGEPSRLNYIWSSQLWGEDTITIMHTDNNSCSSSATGGTYYIAAYGFSNSSYTIVAGVDDGLPTRLSIGQPQSGQVYRGAPQLYFVSKPAGSANLTIAVSPSYGDPDVYVTLDGSTPSLTNFAYRAVGSSGVDAVTITAAAVGCALSNQSKCFCDSCDVYVSVIAFTARASYVITASTGDTTITLQDGVTYRGQVSQFAYSYFRYMNTQASASVTVSMTALSGDPDIAATQNFPNPTLSNNTWVSLRQGSDMIFANNLVIGPLYIGVFGFTNASFAIVVHAASGNSTTQLVDGQPSFGSVNATDYLFFAYSIDDAADVTFTVTPLFGSVAMYVNTCQGSSLSNCINRRPYAVNYQWNANDSLSSESIFISKTDPHACSNCLYIIGVLGNTQSDFVVMGSLSWNSTAISLQEFIPYRSYVDQWDFRYFVFTFYDTHQDVIISVTPLTGDPDLYVTSCFEAGNDSCVYQPSNTTYTWKRTSVGADTLSIPFGSLGACVPQPPNPCSYYIGVQGFTDSSFTITAYLHSDQPVLLLDGRPQNGVVNATVLDQYYMPIQPNTTGIDITLIPRSGDSDLFVTLNGEKPTQDVYQYRAISAFGNDNIEIAATDFPFVNASCATLGCQLRIAVMGFRTSEYTLIASAGTNCKSLVPGVPMRDAVSVSSYDYYCFSVDQAAPFAIVVTPLSGDPDLFVSWGSGNNKPNSTNYIWSSQRIGVDSVTVYPNDPRACPIGTVGCTYYIGVYGYSQNTSFIITAYVLDSNPVELVDGQPQNGQVDTTLLQQYVYYAPAGFGTLLVTLSPVFGDPDLYVSINSTQPPSPSHFDYASLGTSGPEVISISDSDPAVIAGCAGLNGNSNSNGDSNLCPILIGVHGFTNASFQIVAVGGNLPVDLSNGVQMYGTVNHGQYRYYVYRNTDPLATVSFAVTPFGGDPDLFVSTTNPTPTAGNCTWASTGIGRDVVEIFPEDSHYCANCNYYVGVSAWSTNASYGVVAFASGNDSVVQLVDGQPVLSLLAQGSTDQYILLAPVGVPVITITLSPLFGDADLYVNLHDYPATPHSFDYSSISASTDDIITVTSNDTAYASSPCNPANANGSSFCEVRIGVSSFSYFSYYSLLASSVNAILLLNGVSQSSSAVAGVYTQFIFENRMSNAEIDFVLTPISGDPDMYVSTSPNPNSTNFLWKANTMGVDIVQVFPLDSRSCVAPCRYYIGITGFGGSTEFTITGTSSANSVPPLLLDGRPQNDYVNASMTKLYFFDALAGTSPSFSIRVSAVYGDPDIYVRLDGTPPNASYYDFRSLSSNADDILTISTSDRKFVNCSEGPQGLGGSVCRVFIAIIGFSASQYSITASNAGNTVILQEGIPVSGQANNTGYVYYKFIASQPHAYTFTLTPVSGDPDFYISCTNSTPSLSNNTWFSNGLSSEVITIDPTNDPRAAACGMPARYFIGVTGFLRPAAYQLLVTSSCTLLQDGLPQQGQVGPYGMACFLYRATSSPGDITFQFTTLQGSVQLYVNNVLDENGNIIIPSANCTTGTCVVSNYLWTSLSSQDRSSAVVPASNTSACTNCYYAVGVLSNANATAGFSLRATAGGNVVTLSDGVPVSNIVPRGSFQYYRVVVTQPDVDIEIIATPNYGDPDLYVSWTPSNTRPNRTSYDAASTSQYNDTLYVQSVNFASCLQQQSGSGCDLYIGVYGFSNSSYTLVALLKGFNPIVLVSGVPQAMTLQAHEWVYFSAFVNLAPGQPFGFEVTPVYGDPDMYVTTDGSQPTATNNNYSSTDFGFDAVLIAPGSAGYCTRCTVVVGVVAFQSTQFSILFTLDANSTIITLRDSVPEYAQLSAGTFRYYKVFIDSQVTQFTVSISALSGSPQAYMIVENTDYGQYVLPTFNNAQWSSILQGATSITASTSDASYRAPAVYVIGIYSNTTATLFISASLSRTPVTQLYDGQPLTSSVGAGGYSYFLFSTGSAPPSNITVRVSNPSMVLYAVSNYQSENPSTLPTTNHYDWTSLDNPGNPNVLTIQSVNMSNQFFTIGVYSVSGGTFQIIASSQETVVTLLPGAPSSRFSIAQNVTQHFRVDVSDITRNLVISVSPLSGDPDVYVSRRSQNPGCYFPGDVTPNRWSANDFCFNYTWSSSSASIDVLVIQWNNPCASPPANASVCNAVVDWVPGPFYIGVFAYQASTFDITVYQSGAVSSLVNGQAQYASTNGYIPAYFVLPVPSSYIRPSIGFTVTAYATPQNTSVTTQPTGVQLYVVACHSGACSSQDQTPGPSHYTWGKFVTIAAGAASLFVVDMDPNYCDSSVGGVCNYFLGVYADTRCAYQGCAVNFQVQATITGGDAVKTISYDEINNTISLHSDFVPVNDLNSAARYEVWPGGVTAPPQLFFELDGCSGPSNAIPTLYLCTSACPIPSQPTWGNNSQAVVKVGAGAGASTQVFFNAPSDAMFAAVAAPYTRSEHNLRVLSEEMTILPHTPWRRQLAESQFLSMALGDGTSFTFSLTVASSSSLIQLWSPEKLVQLSAAPDAFDGRRVIGFEVSWTAPVLYNITSGGRVLVNSARPVGIQYTIYYAAGGFPPAVRSATACGLDQASQAENVQSQVLSTGTSWTADNLEPSTFYEVNVIAYCGPQCWNTTGLQSSSVLLGRYAYRAASFTTPAAAPTPTSPNTTIIVVVVVLVSLVIAAIVFAYYRKRKAARRVQYEMFEMSEAGGMYATSGDVYSAMD